MSCRYILQVEYLNPGGTSKDRIAASMIAAAESSGELVEGGTVVEGTSGSTGICLASLCRAKGYHCVIVMPDDQVSSFTLKKVVLRILLELQTRHTVGATDCVVPFCGRRSQHGGVL